MVQEDEFNLNKTENKEIESYRSVLKNIKENETSIKSISKQIEILAQVFDKNLNDNFKDNNKKRSKEITSIKSDLNTIEERYITIYRELRSISNIHSKQIEYILYRQDKIYNLFPLRLTRKIKSYLRKIITYLSKRKNKLFNQKEDTQYDKIIMHNFKINDEPKKIINFFKTSK